MTRIRLRLSESAGISLILVPIHLLIHLFTQKRRHVKVVFHFSEVRGETVVGGFEIQKLSDGRSMIFIPSVPNAFSGVTQILPADQITYLDAPMTQIMEYVERYGHGVELLLATKVSEDPSPATLADQAGEDETPDQ